MTNIDELLMLMQDGTPYTFEEIVEATGMSETQVRNAIYRLTAGRLLTAKPVLYRVTPGARKVIADIRSNGPGQKG